MWAALPPGHPSGGSLCDLVVLPSREVQPRPIGVDEAGAAALPYSGLLALHALRRQCGVRMGETPAVPVGLEQGGRRIYRSPRPFFSVIPGARHSACNIPTWPLSGGRGPL